MYATKNGDDNERELDYKTIEQNYRNIEYRTKIVLVILMQHYNQ